MYLVVIVMYRRIYTDEDLPKPKNSCVIYLQTKNGWKQIPDGAATMPRSIRMVYWLSPHGSVPETLA